MVEPGARAARPAGVVDRRHARVARSPAASGRRLTRTPMMLGLNLALARPGERERATRAAAAGRCRPGLLAALEIGNEPDLYTQPRTFRVGTRR